MLPICYLDSFKQILAMLCKKTCKRVSGQLLKSCFEFFIKKIETGVVYKMTVKKIRVLG